MNIFKLFFSNQDSDDSFTLRFSKTENRWRVMKGFSIMYVGNKIQCENYMKNMC